MRKTWFLFFLLCGCVGGFANTVNLLNDTSFPLRAVLYGANGTQLGEFVLNSRDATQWSDDFMDLETDQSNASLTPYTVNWYCMKGAAYGVCTDVSPGALVTAQSCGGTQECSQ